jgi:exodeoxyribonuclease VII large subunit
LPGNVGFSAAVVDNNEAMAPRYWTVNPATQALERAESLMMSNTFFPNEAGINEAAPSILTVSQLNQSVGRLLERSFPLTWIAGELSNVTRAASGHWYFTLKDASAQVRAVMFRGRAQYVDFSPREGDKVEVRATIGLYAARGDFQLNVENMRRAGVGNLYEAFIKLKSRLASEGLFDQERKRELPVFPRTIGIVTSPQAAALRDVLSALRRRAPHIQVVLYPTAVQGEGSAEKIAAAIRNASQRAECDVLLVSRGGGSLEDLWSFNDERVARAIADCAMPVISGVGHETDVTIADFVADVRAPTPTAAAELAATPRDDWFSAVGQHADDLTDALRRQLDDRTQTLDWLAHRLQSPGAAIRHQQLRLSTLQSRLQHATTTPLVAARYRLDKVRQRLMHALPDTRMAQTRLSAQATQLSAAYTSRLGAHHYKLDALRGKLELLAPQRTLERGYAILRDEQGQIIRRTAQLQAPQRLALTVAEGSAHIEISRVEPDKD